MTFKAKISARMAAVCFKGCIAAFTLVELLVAMAVMTILLVIMLEVTASTLNIWRNSEGKMAAGREGEGALQLIRQDLQSILMPTNTNLWPQVVGTNGVRFLALKPSDFQATGGGNGDVCFVEYRFQSNAIERGSADSEETFRSLTNNPVPAFPVATNFQMVATNVVNANWSALMSDGNPVPSGEPPQILQLSFLAAPSASALQNYLDGINKKHQQMGSFFMQMAVPVPR
jgi:prepilin-type N-terminal cleavage/methylation domain-containing protein